MPSEHSLGGLPRRGRGHQDRRQSRRRLHRRWVSYAEHKKRPVHRQRRGRPRAGWMVLVLGSASGLGNGTAVTPTPRPGRLNGERDRAVRGLGSPRSRRWTAPMQPRAASAHPRQRAARPPHSFDRSGVQGLQVGRHRVRGAGPASCRAATDQPQRLCGATTFHVARRTVSERVASSTSPSGPSSPAADPCA